MLQDFYINLMIDIFDTMKRVGQEGVQYNLICDENAYDMAGGLSNWGNISFLKRWVV